MPADADDGGFIDSVDVQGDAVGLLNFEGREDTLSSGHRISSLRRTIARLHGHSQ
jgi:hypothetical protein